MRSWRLLDTGRSRGAYNMAVDEVLARSMAGAERVPILRLFGWAPPAVSFGYSQDPRREVDLEKCRRAGVEWVRRPTGGRAVLHWEELTYSVICRQEDPQLGGPIEATYRVIGECLVEGLRRFGADAALERVSDRTVRPRGAEAALPCFSSIARWEVKCRGRKLVGSAQRRVDGVILQHGSLLIGDAHRKIVDLLPPMAPLLRQRWKERLEERSIHLRACVDREIDMAELTDCMVAGFASRLGAELRAGALTPAEEQQAQELVESRYGDPHWTGTRRDGTRAAIVGRPKVEPVPAEC